MRVVRPDLVKMAVESVRTTKEWPHYSIFVYLSACDAIVIAPRTYLHGDLFVMLKEDWKDRGNEVLELRDPEVFDGHVEWEDDGSFKVQTERGTRLPPEIDSQVISILHAEGK